MKMAKISEEERARRKNKQVFDLTRFEVVTLENWCRNRRMNYEEVEEKLFDGGWSLKEIEQGYLEKDKFKDFM